MKPSATQEEIDRVKDKIESSGLKTHISTGEDVTIIGIIGDKSQIATLELTHLNGVEKTVHITEKYKLVSRNFHPADSIIDCDGIKIGGNEIVVMAGPCAVESEEQLFEAAESVKKSGAKFLRGGAFKPRTSPYDFQGLAEDGLKLLRKAADKFDLKVVTEIIDQNDVELVEKYSDILQVGARNAQNFQLLKALGKSKKPVLLKRGLSETISEWLNAAEYIINAGTPDVILCERGIRTYEVYTRNTLDLSAVAAVKHLSHLPIIVDPSHGTGLRDKVEPMSCAAVAAGCDGLIIEVHYEPDCAVCDGAQSLYPAQYNELYNRVKQIAPIVGKEIL